jgi:arsenate reductase-like glutaredoxin family protein
VQLKKLKYYICNLIRNLYHTQESRVQKLTEPIPCKRDDAWLGEGKYFWYDLLDAEQWGNSSKKATGFFEIYESEVDCEDVLDTVFNEEHYNFWLKQLEKVAMKIIKKTNEKPTLKELNDYFKERGTWNEVCGIIFQDLPTNNKHLLVKPIEYKNKTFTFAYRKRVQMVIYDDKIIRTFAFLTREKCINLN